MIRLEIRMTQKHQDQKKNPFNSSLEDRLEEFDGAVDSGSIPRNRNLYLIASIFLLAAVCVAGYWNSRARSSSANGVRAPGETSYAAIGRTFNKMQLMAEKNGSVRIIIGLRGSFVPEGQLTESQTIIQRTHIAAMQSAVLNKVESLGKNQTNIKRFAIIPFMAVEANPAELERLGKLVEVSSIEEDHIAKSADTQSTDLLGVPNVWSSNYTGSGQTIAILDSGVDGTHPFLIGKVVSESCYSSNTTADGATSACPGGVTQSTAVGSAMPYGGACPAGSCDHGTVVAGIAAGTNSTFSGVAKGASLIAIQVFSIFNSVTNCGSSSPCTLTYASDQILGMQQVYALRNKYQIAAINLSLGSGKYSSQSTCDSENGSMKAIIDTLRSVNIPTIAASGNSGFTNSMAAPACISSAISVGATFDRAGYSNNCAGNDLGISAVDDILCESDSTLFLNLLAPGAEITSSIPGGEYEAWYGTSMAVPQVTGAWALMKQKNNNLSISSGLNALTATGVQIKDARNNISKPRIQIDQAVASVL
jgi:subtilisin family serine protease